jgi:hypothetical protein
MTACFLIPACAWAFRAAGIALGVELGTAQFASGKRLLLAAGLLRLAASLARPLAQ